LLIWKYKTKLNEVAKGVVGVIIAASIFIWRWLGSVSLTAEITAAFAVTLIGIVVAFLIDERDIKI
jgi:multisubunit Na+/H+ antiporter MnhG subunit